MPTQFTLADCVRLAEFAHFHQKDKSGANYIDHPKRVLRAVQDEGAPPYVQMAAVLHDVTEDTPFTHEMLLALGVPEAAVIIVRLLDRNESLNRYTKQVDSVRSNVNNFWWNGSSYVRQDEIPSADEFYYHEIRKNPGARQCKRADIRDNRLPWRVVYLPEATQIRLAVKYDKAEALLEDPA